jgi:inorganic pyrophosphatase
VKSPIPSQLSHREPASGRVHVLIDTPAGSRNKYKFDTDLGVFCISRRLPAGLSFPHDFGFIPRTCAEDGDALDALVVGAEPCFPGCLVSTRLIGVIEAEQVESGKRLRNDRLIACAETRINPARFRDLAEVPEESLRGIEVFFEAYNRAEGREFRILGRGHAQDAEAALEKAVAAFASGRA